MWLHVKNIPYLMRHGLHWSRANILVEKSFVALHGSDPELTSDDKRLGWLYTRTFFLHYNKVIDDEGESG